LSFADTNVIECVE